MSLEALRQVQVAAGATCDSQGIPQHYGSAMDGIALINNGVGLCDHSHWGCLQFTGADRHRFLHNQSTNQFEQLSPGQGCETVFVTSTARTIDLAIAQIYDDKILALVSPQRRQYLQEWLDRYIFPFDQVALTDVSGSLGIFSVVGVTSDALLDNLGLAAAKDLPLYHHRAFELQDFSVEVIKGSSLASPGYWMMTTADHASSVWQALHQAGASPLGAADWEALRVLQGRPMADQELTDDYNPLEAGLWHTVSFDKGCYIGQETIARLNTYKGVKQRLWGLKLDAIVPPQTPIFLENNKVGVVTSVQSLPQGIFGMGYIRTKAGGIGLNVSVEGVAAEVIPLDYVQHPEEA